MYSGRRLLLLFRAPLYCMIEYFTLLFIIRCHSHTHTHTSVRKLVCSKGTLYGNLIYTMPRVFMDASLLPAVNYVYCAGGVCCTGEIYFYWFHGALPS